jgi:2-C-methyl-D-erythritol 4-phosphate cytidylyltransferase
VAAQTPQAFPADTLRRAFAGDLADATDCSSLVEASGGRVVVVEGDAQLLKITTRADLEIVESWL